MQTDPEEKLSSSRQIMGQTSQTVVGAIQMDALLVLAIIQDHIEAAGHRDNELLQFLVSVPTTL